MRIEIWTIDSEKYCPEDITEICFTQSAGIACDSLSVNFKSTDLIQEITEVKAFDRGELIFNGCCDQQRIRECDKGFEINVFARSSASLLTDNEAEPFTYNMPSAKQLWFTFAKKFGFKYALPDVQGNEKYEIVKGTSCYGAISQFVSLTTGDDIRVTPQNSITVLRKSENIKSLNSYNILSAQAVINRSEPLSEICFKKTSSSAGYKLHTCAGVKKDMKLNDRKQYINLSSLPQWQREYTVTKKLKDSYKDYKILEVVVSGFVKDRIYQRFSYKSVIGMYREYLLTEKKFIYDKNAERTKLVLKKDMDIKEITYVD